MPGPLNIMLRVIAIFAVVLFHMAITGTAQTGKAVYAHFMFGVVEKYMIEDWKIDIVQAQAIGIDGFALNCAPPRIDSYTPKQLANAYEAAAQLDFKMFISFDFAYWSTGDTAEITSFVGQYSTHPAQAYYNGGAIVSTFVGDNMNWIAVDNGLPGGQKITPLPMIQDPNYIPQAAVTNGIDSAFSWYAWATDGGNSVIPGPMTTIWDDRFLSNLGDKPYLAPVSPWFFTHFNTKNWVFIAEEQPTRRWEQMLTMKPELIEIISWNDFGESHYISGSQPNNSDDDDSAWAAGYPHDAWRTLMKPYIAAYKAGTSVPSVSNDGLVYWFRPTPKDVKCTNDGLGPPRGYELLADVVFVTTMLTQPAELTVKSGTGAAVTKNVGSGIVTSNFTMGVGTQEFTVTRGGVRLFGGASDKKIVDSCEKYNYNPYVGSFSA